MVSTSYATQGETVVDIAGTYAMDRVQTYVYLLMYIPSDDVWTFRQELNGDERK